MSIIKVSGLSKSYKILNRKEGMFGALRDLVSSDYRYIEAVKSIDLDIKKGEIVGFLGPNGAGKSTTIKMLTGILKPSAGDMLINGFEPYSQRRKYVANIGTVFGQRSQLWWDIPVIESFKILKEIYKISDEHYNTMMQRFEELAELSKLHGQSVRSLSLGQRMICDIAAAFLHNPEVIFLDEPSIGLDVSIKRSMRHLIKTLNEEYQTTVVLTSHDMGDIESLCERVILIDKGSIIYDGSTEKFTKIFGDYRALQLDVPEVEPEQQVATIRKALSELPELQVETFGTFSSQITFKQEDISLVSLLGRLQPHLDITDFRVKEMDMESVVHKVYSGALTWNSTAIFFAALC